MTLPMKADGRAVVGALQCGEPGAPAWVDLGTIAGTTTAARFYCSLFGWRVVARHRPLEDPVGYWVFQEDGKDVGGLSPAREAVWTMYLGAADVDANARAVTAHGGTVLRAPATVVGAGRMAVCADPLGATFVLWQTDQPGAHPAGNAHPSARHQLACRDPEAAIRFYGSAFGWEATTTPMPGASYTELFCPGVERSVAGIVQVDDRWGEDVPARWMTHFAVTDTDGAAARATALGATVSVAPFDLPNVGRMAVIDDPESARFSVLQAA